MNTATQAMNDATKEMAFYLLLSGIVGIGQRFDMDAV